RDLIMTYSPKDYAQSFCDVILKTKSENKIGHSIKNFLDLVRRNRDQKKLKEIIDLAENIINQKTGRRKITIESARELKGKNKKTADSCIRKTDKVERKINPDLLAGVRITINNEFQIDGSFSNKIKKVLNI
ncbi:MAG: F0F1 ATP synthase subunit delta, partial [bacterium]|nr:F0F1 ATP synthase subunit delta [bacterium]